KSLHGGIEAIALLELNGEAFRKTAGANSRRIEGLQDGKHRLNFCKRGIKLLRSQREVPRQIAGLVYEIDEILPDDAARWVGDGEDKLLREMVRERRLRGYPCLEIVVLGAAFFYVSPCRVARESIRLRA